MLGSTILSLFKDTYHIVGYTKNDLDVVDYKEVQKKISFENPNIIIHGAANTNAEECEGNKNLAYNVNAIGTQNIVNAFYTITKTLCLFTFRAREYMVPEKTVLILNTIQLALPRSIINQNWKGKKSYKILINT